jgi:hypothetical protein
MKMMTKTIGAIAILGALAGCAGDESAPPSTPQPSVGQAPARQPMGGPGPKKGDGKMEGVAPSAAPVTTDGKKSDAPPKLESPSKADASKPAGTAAKLSAKELAGIKELPEAEQAAATAQAVCPVSQHNLGGMGKPIKVTAEGRTFYLCCDDCKEEVNANAKAIVAKLDELKAGK